MAATPRTRSKPKPWADTAEAIQGRRLMDVTLLSGAQVTLRTVTLDELAVEEAIPNDLLAAAVLDSADLLLPQMLNEIQNGKPEEARKLSQATLALERRVCARAIVAPEPTDELLDGLDGFDRKMVVEIAQRKRSTDATGKVVAAQSLADFTRFREVGDGAAGGKARDDGGV